MVEIFEIKRRASALAGELSKIRRHLHAHPELSFAEKQTAAYVAQRLAGWGIASTQGLGGYGVVAHVGGKSGDPVVALRADMDALPIQELNDVPYASVNAGVMHACGHDVHTACLLGAAHILKSMESELEGQIRLIFQPSEERLPGGASLMIADGVLKNPDVEWIFGQHVYPDMEVGNVGFRQGMYMASADEIYITVKGKGGHAALPHTLVDPVPVASYLVVALQQVVSRRTRADIPAVLSVGRFIGEGATNIIPDMVKMEGTLRCMDEEVREQLHREITNLTKGLCESMGAMVELEIRRGYPCLNNDTPLTAWAQEQAVALLGRERVHQLPLRMTAEDFAYYAQEIPACFYRLGTSNSQKNLGAPLHTAHFDIDEGALEIGAALMATLGAKSLERAAV